MCLAHCQHRHVGGDKLELPLGWMSGAIANDYDIISKIGARHGTAIASSTRDNGRMNAARECASSKWCAKNRTTSTAPAPYQIGSGWENEKG